MNDKQRDSGFALILTVMISLIVAALIATMAVSANSGLKLSRTSGDSANALQVADAGINAAVKTLTDYTGSSPLVLTSTLSGSGDNYKVTAKQESTLVWHLDAVGIDSNGAQRRIKADAVATPLLVNAVFAKTSLSFGSGVAVDSYSGGMTVAQTCNGQGFVGTNDPAANDINVKGGGGGVRNCTSQVPGFNPSGGYVFDGCVGYAATEPVPSFKNENQNEGKNTCGVIKKATPLLELETVNVAGLTPAPSNLDCSGPMNLPPGKYFYHSITLRDGCVLPSTAATQFNPVKIYTDGPLNIGTKANDVVNAPPAGCPGTAPVGNDYYAGTNASPLAFYCAGWPGRTQIFTAGSGSVNLENHVRFFGVVVAPERVVQGGPQPVIWGAVAASSVDSGAQVTVHYDEALGALTTGRYSVAAWRETSLSEAGF